MFYTYHQNNSGGSFAYDESRGIANYVIVEAANSDEADARALNVGLYFDGCDQGLDCDCCGDRWYSAYGDGSFFPEVYDRNATLEENYSDVFFGDGISRVFVGPGNYTTFVHYHDGRIVGHGKRA